MSPEWSAEQVVTEELARRLIETQFRDLRLIGLHLLGEGWDNTAWEVNETFVFRFPRRPIAVPLLEAEATVLPKIAGKLPLPIPVPIYLGQSCDEYPWPFLGYRKLPGNTGDRADLNDEQRRRIARPLAGFLRTLHAIDAAEVGAPPESLGRLNLQKRIPQSEQRLAEAVALGLIDEAEPWLQILRNTPSGYVPRNTTLVQGDLYSRHILVDDQRTLCGVIDWGDVHSGDVAVDLAIAHSFLPAYAREEFRAEYGPIDDTVWQIARFRALHHAAITLVYGHAMGDECLLRESRGSLARLLAE